jgi:YD repeat-containing protein
VRHTHTDYLVTNPANGVDYTSYNTAHLRSLATQSSVYDAAGVEQARTTFEYDYYVAVGGRAPLTNRPGITGLDAAYTTSYRTRGNVTASSGWLLASGTPVTSYRQYDVAGNVVASVDPLGHVSQVSFSDSFSDGINRNTFAHSTSTTSAVPDPTNQRGSNTPLVSSAVYDYSTGLIASSTDVNGKTTTTQYGTQLDRLTRVDHPDGGRTIYNYVDSHPCGAYVETRTLLDASGREIDAYQFFDGLGRGMRSFKNEPQDAANPWTTADTRYDSLGRVSQVSHPYHSTGCTSAVNPSGRWTTTTYDALGRVKTVTTPDAAVVTTDYSGNQVTMTDQAGKRGGLSPTRWAGSPKWSKTRPRADTTT